MSANDPVHYAGQSVETNDQLSSVVLMGIAIAGGLAAVVLSALVI